MKYFPAFLTLEGRDCLVVGGGEPAVPKVRLLGKAGAKVTVVAPAACETIRTVAERREIKWLRRRFDAADVSGRALVYVATGLAEVDQEVAAAARAAGIPVGVADRPDLSSFITPAIIDRDPVVVCVSTGGAAPVLARRIRAAIEVLLPSRIGELARFASRFRAAVTASIPELRMRRRFWERFFDGPIASRVLAGDHRGATETMLAAVNRRRPEDDRRGTVAIVGAGPGDPGLLTLRALNLLQTADVVVYDKLVSPAVLEYARRDAERVDVGKSKGDHPCPQHAINALLARHAAQGKRVVRLKGGDPFIFGRGGEERSFLEARGVAVEVVPGITAAIGCAAAAGIPLTQRGVAQAVTFVTGHGADGEPDLDWEALARLGGTVAIYMGVTHAEVIQRRLLDHGLAPETAAAIVENGTLPTQRIFSGRLGGLARLVRDNGIAGPGLIVIGEVVRLAGAASVPAVTEPRVAVAV